jgi:hypothetical protein
MRARTLLPFHSFPGTALALTAVVAVSMVLTSCSSSVQPGGQPPPNPKVYTCRDRPIKIDKGYAHGVDKDLVVVCSGVHVSWKGTAPWEVRFATSPFVGGETVITDQTDQSKVSAVKPEPVDNDTPFEYSATTSDGVKHDPQIIIMGGS